MTAPEKKFLCPVIYPKDRALNREWFIKYKMIDWNNGGYKYGKYKGLLNLIPTIEGREAQAQEYIQMIKRGDPLPCYQGARGAVIDLPTAKEITNIKVCCDRFLKIAETQGKEGATIAQYKSKLKLFNEWITAQGKNHLAIGGLTDQDAQDFMFYIKLEKKLCNHTFNAYKSLLARVWDIYKRNITHNPWKEIANLRKNTKHLKDFPQWLQELIEATLPGFDRQLYIMESCIYYCGIRPHRELRRMKIKHIRFDEGLFVVPAELSKTHKQRIVNIYHKLLQEMIAAGYDKADPEHYIFSHHGQPGPKMVSKNTFMMKWNKYREAFGIDKIYKLYGGKHTGGKKLTKEKNAQWTKEHFGHSDIQTTQSYVENWDHKELVSLQDDFPEFAK